MTLYVLKCLIWFKKQPNNLLNHTLLTLFSLLLSTSLPAQVVLNEVMSANDMTVADEDGDYSDWIELYHKGTAPINLQGYRLTDDTLRLDKWTFPSITLASEAHLLVFASDKNRTGAQLHTNFKLRAAGEDLWLVDPQGRVMDRLPVVALAGDQSFGRKPDGGDLWVLFMEATPGATNSQIGFPPLVDTLTFSVESGFYPENTPLSITSHEGIASIHYTLDGSLPTANSPKWESPFTLTDRTPLPNTISTISTSHLWKAPIGQVPKATVIRAAAFRQGAPSSRVYTHTYLVGNLHFTFPVISLVTDPAHFFGYEEGIYVSGKLGDESPYGNYTQGGEKWERPVHVSFFSEEGQLEIAQDMGVRIHGRGSRGGPQKSLRFYARSEYGDNYLEYPLFPDRPYTRYKRFLLRTPSSDWGRTGIKDALIHSLLPWQSLEIQAFRPTIVFLNGEYWGIQNLRERHDKHYLAQHFGVDDDAVDILEEDGQISEGDNADYLALLDFVRAHDLRDSVQYQTVAEQIDIEAFILYYIAQLYAMNTDWPVGNTRFWREQAPNAKWRWFFYDQDASFQRFADNPFTPFIYPDFTPTPLKPEWGTVLLQNLLKNERFNRQFRAAFHHHLSTTFAPARVISQIDSLQRLFEPEMVAHIRRWGQPRSLASWLAVIDDLRTFAAQRPFWLREYLLQDFGSPLRIFPNPSNGQWTVHLDAPVGGEVEVTLLDLTGRKLFNGRYVLDGNGGTEVRVSGLLSGVYLMQVKDVEGFWVKKVVVE